MIDSSFDTLKSFGATALTVYAVNSGCPDDFYIPTIAEAENAVKTAEKLRKFVVEKMRT